MDFRREESSDSSRDRYEQHEDNTDSAKRSFKCTFCRRGFTNAQALGGHMNIHRKDRAKARQISLPSSLQTNQKDYQSRPPPKDSSYPFFETQSNYQFYYQPPAGNFPANPHLHESTDWFIRNSRPLGTRQELLGANLSLRIGPMISEEGAGSRAVWKNDEVDLELRLGHDP